MTTIQTRLRVNRDGTVTGHVDKRVPPGEHEAIVIVADEVARNVAANFPVDDCGPWPPGFSLSRHDMYGGDGR